MLQLLYNALNGAPAEGAVGGEEGAVGGEEGVTKKKPEPLYPRPFAGREGCAQGPVRGHHRLR